MSLDKSPNELVVALAGNPNTGKSTIFNALTGLRQHTGNWPGKTISRAEGSCSYQGQRLRIIDLPGTYSLLSASDDEEIARNFILFGQPDVTVIVVDATALERNLNLALQVLQITDRAVLALNLMDEAEAHGITVDASVLSRELGIPVVPTVARKKEGINKLLDAILEVASGRRKRVPLRAMNDVPGLSPAISEVAAHLQKLFPGLHQSEWIAWRLLEGDETIRDAVASGEIRSLCGLDKSSDSSVAGGAS